jgi:hypothetical protein
MYNSTYGTAQRDKYCWNDNFWGVWKGHKSALDGLRVVRLRFRTLYFHEKSIRYPLHRYSVRSEKEKNPAQLGNRTPIIQPCRQSFYRLSYPYWFLQMMSTKCQIRFNIRVLQFLTVTTFLANASSKAFMAVTSSALGIYISMSLFFPSWPLHPEDGRQHGPLKRWYPTTTLHGVTTPKTSTWYPLAN